MFHLFLRDIDIEKVLQELFWVDFCEHPYRLNDTKIHLDAALKEHRCKCKIDKPAFSKSKCRTTYYFN